MIKVDLINGIKTENPYGFKVYVDEINQLLKEEVEINEILYTPSKSQIVHFFQRFVEYPLRIMAGKQRGAIKHITTPDLAYLLNMFRFRNCLINVYDVTFLERIKDYNIVVRFLLRLNVMGIKKAKHIVTLSEYSKRDIHEKIGVPLNDITIIVPSLNHKVHKKNRSKEILKKYGVEKKTVVMYVGSEELRQNMDKTLRMLKEIKKDVKDVVLVKVGNPQWSGGRENTLRIIKELGLEKDVIIVPIEDSQSAESLSKFYNAADVLVYPCAYTGWGLPPLEAMACGTPVVTSNTTSLPEVVGDAGIMIKPDDIKAYASAVIKVLKDKKTREKMIKKGLARAKKFTWDASSKKMLAVYKRLDS
ncbi:MAG: glycosyltransferase family 1 protein [archaeon]